MSAIHELTLLLFVPLNLTLGLLACGLIGWWYVWPHVRDLSAREALIPLMLPHCFRYVGLTFLVNGVTHVPIDPRFSDPTAYGDFLTCLLALASVLSLRAKTSFAIPLVWATNVVGLADLINAFPVGLKLLSPGDFGAVIYIVLVFVPVLLVSHFMMIGKLLRKAPQSARA
jgi:hypothetical protein